MALTKYKLGDLIQLLDNRNTELIYGSDDVRGVNNLKELMPTKADISGRDLSKFQIVYPDEFVFNHRTSRNGSKFSIAYNDMEKPVICSEDYVVFRITDEAKQNILSARWLYMFFKRSEFDRYVITNSWGSSTEFFNWEDICEIDIDLPPISIQQKYVDVYNAMLANQQSYERGLEDLKLVCDGYIDKLKKKQTLMRPLGLFIEKHECKNSDDKYGISQVKGISNKKEFGQTKADVQGKDLSKFLVIDPGMFAYNPRTDGRDMLVLALNREAESVLVTWNYNAFRIKPDFLQNLDPKYLYLLLCRSEFDRLVRFDSWGSSQELFSWDSLCDVNIPVPSIEVQKALLEINVSYIERKHINEHLKERIKNMCPILIKGSLEEAGA